MSGGVRRDYLSLLVVGAGSIGRRHVANLRALGISRVAVCDPNAERCAALQADYQVEGYGTLDEALTRASPTAVMVCSPPHLHVPQAIKALKSGAHVFIEKPLSNSLDGVEVLISEMVARQRVVQVGYNWRFHAGLQRIKALLEAGAIGRVTWARAESGQFLPDWRPDQDYRKSYTAHREMGGGIILDGSHELDYMRWLLGEVSHVYCQAGRLSDLEVDVEDTAFIILNFQSGCVGEVHLDFVQRARARNCKIVGTEGTILWDNIDESLNQFIASRAEWTKLDLEIDPNAKYVAEVADFLSCIEEQRAPRVDLYSARRVLEIALAARHSAATGQSIELK